jgi:hypothetical protein
VGATRFSARRGPESEAQEVPGTSAKKRRVDVESMVGAEVDEVVSDYFRCLWMIVTGCTPVRCSPRRM